MNNPILIIAAISIAGGIICGAVVVWLIFLRRRGQGGTPLNIQAIANVKISTDPDVVGNAIERFLDRDRPVFSKRFSAYYEYQFTFLLRFAALVLTY